MMKSRRRRDDKRVTGFKNNRFRTKAHLGPTDNRLNDNIEHNASQRALSSVTA